jgi:hypothetical protein
MFTTAQTREQIRIQRDALDAAVQLGTAGASARVLQLQMGIDIAHPTADSVAP